ncbi:MAG: hypothetical protein AB7U20_05765 [Planctomycetaceae bacterium]
MPAIVFAVLVVGLCAALVFDRLWLDMARIELRTAAEAAAFAAAGRLADDDRLRSGIDPAALLDAARAAAVGIAAENRVAGIPVRLVSTPGEDVRFGVVVDNPDTGEAVFLETEHDPSTIVVTAQAIRSRGNGVALFFRKLTGVAAGNVIGRAGVTIDNAVLGVRPLTSVGVPALPLGILEDDAASHREDTWERQIVQRQGGDRFGFDETSQHVTQAADGIPEITLTVAGSASQFSGTGAAQTQRSPNCCIVDIGNGLSEENVRRQIAEGWTAEDLADLGGQFVMDGSPAPMRGSATMVADMLGGLERTIGQPRICVLYRYDGRSYTSGAEQLIATRLIAGRILSIDGEESGSVQLVFQPTVMTTPTAVLASAGASVDANPYIYKLHLTH